MKRIALAAIVVIGLGMFAQQANAGGFGLLGGLFGGPRINVNVRSSPEFFVDRDGAVFDEFGRFRGFVDRGRSFRSRDFRDFRRFRSFRGSPGVSVRVGPSRFRGCF